MATPRPEPVGASGPVRDAETVLEAARTHVPGAAVVDAARIGGREHLQAAIDHALAAVEAGRARAREPSMEVILHAAGTDQIEDALADVGLEGPVEAVALVDLGDGDVEAFLDALAWSRDGDALEPSREQVRALARRRGWTGGTDPVDWLVEDAALVALG